MLFRNLLLFKLALSFGVAAGDSVTPVEKRSLFFDNDDAPCPYAVLGRYGVEIELQELPDDDDCDGPTLMILGSIIQEIIDEVDKEVSDFDEGNFVKTEICKAPSNHQQQTKTRRENLRRSLGRYAAKYLGGGECRRCQQDNSDRRRLGKEKENEKNRKFICELADEAQVGKDVAGLAEKQADEMDSEVEELTKGIDPNDDDIAPIKMEFKEEQAVIAQAKALANTAAMTAADSCQKANDTDDYKKIKELKEIAKTASKDVIFANENAEDAVKKMIKTEKTLKSLSEEIKSKSVEHEDAAKTVDDPVSDEPESDESDEPTSDEPKSNESKEPTSDEPKSVEDEVVADEPTSDEPTPDEPTSIEHEVAAENVKAQELEAHEQKVAAKTVKLKDAIEKQDQAAHEMLEALEPANTDILKEEKKRVEDYLHQTDEFMKNALIAEEGMDSVPNSSRNLWSSKLSSRKNQRTEQNTEQKTEDRGVDDKKVAKALTDAKSGRKELNVDVVCALADEAALGEGVAEMANKQAKEMVNEVIQLEQDYGEADEIVKKMKMKVTEELEITAQAAVLASTAAQVAVESCDNAKRAANDDKNMMKYKQMAERAFKDVTDAAENARDAMARIKETTIALKKKSHEKEVPTEDTNLKGASDRDATTEIEPTAETESAANTDTTEPDSTTDVDSTEPESTVDVDSTTLTQSINESAADQVMPDLQMLEDLQTQLAETLQDRLISFRNRDDVGECIKKRLVVNVVVAPLEADDKIHPSDEECERMFELV